MILPKLIALIALAGAALLPHPAANAQHHPQITYTAPEEIAPGALHYSGSSTSPRWQVQVIEVDMANRNINLVPVASEPSGSLERTSSMATRVNAVAAINAGYFWNNVSVSHLEIDGEVLAVNGASRPPRSTFGVSANHQELMLQERVGADGETTVSGNPQWSRVVDAIGAGPRLISDGEIDPRHDEEGFDAASGVGPEVRHPRTALGWDEETGTVWLVTVDGRQPTFSVGMTLAELAGLLIDLGATEGMNYDGGGSTTAWVNGQVVNSPSGTSERSVASAWAVVPSFVIDVTDEEFSTTGTWSSSANPGFYNENSLFSPAGTGESLTTWQPNLARAGRYEVHAWWVAASNRAMAAPYAVHHREGTTQVFRDQTANGSQWNLLGTFEFNPGNSGRVTLSDHVPGGQYVSADAVKFVLVEELEPTATTGWALH